MLNEHSQPRLWHSRETDDIVDSQILHEGKRKLTAGICQLRCVTAESSNNTFECVTPTCEVRQRALYAVLIMFGLGVRRSNT